MVGWLRLICWKVGLFWFDYGLVYVLLVVLECIIVLMNWMLCSLFSVFGKCRVSGLGVVLVWCVVMVLLVFL